MKFRVNRAEMAEALSVVRDVAASRTTKPLLQCVRIDVQADAVLLSATDLEVSLRSAITQVEVDGKGETLASADTLYRIVHECPDEILVLETEKNLLHVRGKGSHFQIVTQDAAEFPPTAGMEGEPDFTVDHELLRRMVEWTAFAAARESTRYAINGVLWELEGERLTLVATDGRRLSLARGVVKTRSAASIPHVIVPSKCLSLFTRLPFDSGSGGVGVKLTSNQVRFHVGRTQLNSSLVEGNFPKYQDVIPSDTPKTVTLKTAEFLGAIRRASLLTNEESRGIRMSFAPDELTLSSRAPEQGEATVSMPVGYRGEGTDIGFNPTFLQDLLKVAHTDEVEFSFKESNRPGVIRAGNDFLYVVMPVNLSSA